MYKTQSEDRLVAVNSFDKFKQNSPFLISEIEELKNYLRSFCFENSLFSTSTKVEEFKFLGKKYNKFINEFWTSSQRKSSRLHEISYRACFKPELPKFFIDIFTKKYDTVLDPFGGRGTTAIESMINCRNAISNDINPLSEILAKPRTNLPSIEDVRVRLEQIEYDYTLKSDLDLSMFFEQKTLSEILSLKKYFKHKKEANGLDFIDEWIRMVATSRLTGHSTYFFSVYTMPPNLAISAKKQIEINLKRNQKPEYKSTKEIILKKSRVLLEKEGIKQKTKIVFLSDDAQCLRKIADNSIDLVVTSPPFLDVINYEKDNWLRAWFNDIDILKVGEKMIMCKNIEEWSIKMEKVLTEMHRVIKPKGWIAFEVGEVRSGKISLEDYIIPIGIKTGFDLGCVLINQQKFTKTSNIWGVKNNTKGTNSNRIIIFQKKHI